jgi:penicillin-binding protein 1A
MAHRIKKGEKGGKKKKAATSSKRPGWYGKVIRFLWILLLIGILLVSIFFTFLSFQDLPTFEELENPDFELATEVFARDGRELGRYYVENRVFLSFDEINPMIIEALLATEDERYYKHAGVDIRALGRVAVRTVILQQRSAGGGSTISQQLAKLLFPREDLSGMSKPTRLLRLINIKFKEWLTAIKLEKAYTKEEILAMYLNEFDFIYGAHGVQAASETYFGKNQSDLHLEEAATLVGMLKNPSLYNPRRFPENAINRRNVVMNQMVKADKLEKATFDSLKTLTIDMSNFERSSHITGPAPYLRAELAKDLRKLLEQPAFRKSDGTEYNIYRDGLKVYTTIDYDMQKLAEKTMVRHMREVQGRFFTEWRNKDPWTYDDEKIPVSFKKRDLTRLITTSERYQSIKHRFIGKEIAALEESTGYQLRDIDIDRLMQETKKKGTLTRLIAEKLISGSLADSYRKILKQKEWDKITEVWPAMQEAVEMAFNEKVKMKVFTYENEEMEKDTVMTPLDSIKYHRMHLQTGILAIDPANGHIRVWVGGINHKYFKYDHIRTSRQVGSTFKPFIYASAIFFKGISPCYKVDDIPYTISPGEGKFDLLEEWSPKNATGEYTRERFTLYDCLKKSKNTASVFLMKQLGDANLVRGLVHNMGLDSSEVRFDGEYRIPRQPSICLGAADLTVYEMTQAYSTFANNGINNRPILIQRIEDKNGKVIYNAIPNEQIVLDPKANYVMVDMLKYAVYGAPGFDGVESTYGGKTGTTNDHTDGWFMGITPDLVVGTWVGGEDRWIRFLNFYNGQGSRMARPFFSEFLKELEKHDKIDYDPTKTFYDPGELDIELDCNKYRQFEDEIPVEPVNTREGEDFGEDL